MSKIDMRCPRGRRWRERSLAVTGALLAIVLPCGAHAQELPLTLRVGQAFTWDDNVFRQPEGAVDPQLGGTSGPSDRYATTSVGLRFEKGYSRQELLLDVSQSATRYEKFTTLDRDALAYRAAWQWAVGSALTGTLSADRSESIVDFADTQGVQQIERITENRIFAADAWVSGGWHLLGGLSQAETRNSQVFFAQPSTREEAGELGIRYLTASQSSARLVHRERRGENVDPSADLINLIDSEFRVSETQLDAAWVPGGRSTFAASVLSVERRHPNVPQRDFSGSARSLTWAWVPTGRLNITASAARELVPFSLSAASSYRVDDSLSLAGALQLAGRSSLLLRAAHRESDFPVADAGGESLRRDVYRTLEAGVVWRPHRIASLDARLRREQRTSTSASAEFEATIASLGLTLTF